VQPEPTTAGQVTIGWLLAAAAQHKLPAAPAVTDRLRASDEFRLSFERPPGPVPRSSCRTAGGPLVLSLSRGERIGVYDNGVYFTPADSALVGLPLLFTDTARPIVVLRDVGPVEIRAVLPGAFRICRATMQG
jgi:hypothetical protein